MKFDNMTENEAREQILGMVKEYCDKIGRASCRERV